MDEHKNMLTIRGFITSKLSLPDVPTIKEPIVQFDLRSVRQYHESGRRATQDVLNMRCWVLGDLSKRFFETAKRHSEVKVTGSLLKHRKHGLVLCVSAFQLGGTA